MDIYNIDVDQLPEEKKAYFRSELFKSLSPSARIAALREAMEPKETKRPEELEEAKWVDHSRRAELFLQQHAEEERRREEARQAEAKKPRRW